MIAGAAVTLFRRGLGRLAMTTTDQNGEFSFPSLPPSADYWITISGAAYFADEKNGLMVQQGFDAVYEMGLESCSPGRCQPHLMTIPTIGPCA